MLAFAQSLIVIFDNLSLQSIQSIINLMNEELEFYKKDNVCSIKCLNCHFKQLETSHNALSVKNVIFKNCTFKHAKTALEILDSNKPINRRKFDHNYRHDTRRDCGKIKIQIKNDSYELVFNTICSIVNCFPNILTLYYDEYLIPAATVENLLTSYCKDDGHPRDRMTVYVLERRGRNKNNNKNNNKNKNNYNDSNNNSNSSYSDKTQEEKLQFEKGNGMRIRYNMQHVHCMNKFEIDTLMIFSYFHAWKNDHLLPKKYHHILEYGSPINEVC